MTKENTIYHEDSYLFPNSPSIKEKSTVYDDIHTSDWFSTTHRQLISSGNDNNHNTSILDQKEPIKLLCPIIFFIDGVSIDQYGRKSLEPVSFTLGIFKRQIRNLPLAWRVLGYIPNTEKCLGLKYDSNNSDWTTLS